MRQFPALIALSVMSLLGGCVTTQSANGPDVAGIPSCDASKGEAYIGRTVDAKIGEELQRITGARQFRWAPPRSAMTMDYQQDRLTVYYDDAMIITRLDCV